MNTNKVINIGIVGTGFGKMIGLNFKAIDPSCNIYYYGRDKQKLDNAVKEVGAAGVYDSWQELVSDPKIDLVVVANHSAGHKEVFDLAAKNNKNILVEKPAALLSSEIVDMINSNKANDKFVVVNHEARFHPVVSYIKDLIDSNKLGDIMTIRMGAYLNWYSNSEYKDRWDNDKSLGGGQIYSIGTHQIDLARYLLGNPEFVSGDVQSIVYPDTRFTNKPTAESQFSAHYLTKDNTSVQIFNDTYCFGYKDLTLEVFGSRGIVIYSDIKGLKVSFSNSEPLSDVKLIDPMPQITLGSSLISRSMKYAAKAILDSLKGGTLDSRFSRLIDEKENLELFEKYK